MKAMKNPDAAAVKRKYVYTTYKRKAKELDLFVEMFRGTHHLLFTIVDPETGEDVATVDRAKGTVVFHKLKERTAG